MAKQRYNIGVNSLSYSDPTKGSYIAPPVKEVLAFRNQREEDYLTSQKNINLIEETKKVLPNLDVDKPLYDEILNTVDFTLSKITPDNYADNTIKTGQLIHDIKYKLGGKELEDNYKDYQSKSKTISEAKNIRPAMSAYKQKVLQSSLKPITKDDKGKFVVTPSVMPKLVETQDLFKKADDLVKNMKASSLYVHDPITGKITIDSSIIGKYGITKTEFVDEKDLYNTTLAYLSKDPTNAEYLDDEAELTMYENPPTPESVASSMSDVAISTFFPDKVKKVNGQRLVEPVTAEDIAEYTKGNLEAFNLLAKENIKFNQMNTVANSMATIYGYNKEDKTYFANLEYQESVKAKYDAIKNKNKTTTETDGTSSPLVLIKPAYTQVIASPLIFDTYEKNKEQYVQDYVKADEEYNRLLKEVEEDRKDGIDSEPRLRETIQASKEKRAQADAAIQNTKQAEANLTKSVVKIAKDKANLDIEKEFEISNPEIRKDIKNINANTLAYTGYTVDVTDLVKLSFNKKEAIIGQESLPIYTKEQAEANKGHLSSFILKDGNNYKAVIPDSRRVSGHGLTITKSIMEKKNPSMFSSNSYHKESKPIDRTKIKHYPTADEFNNLTAKLFTNPDINVSNYSPTEVVKAKKLALEMRKHTKVSDVTVNQLLDYIFVDDKAEKGTAAWDLLRLGDSVASTLGADLNNYKAVNDNGDLEDLPLYLKSKGLSTTDIDFTKAKISVMLTSDRQYGQKLNMPLVLKQSGIDILKRKGDLDLSETLNVIGVSKAGIDSSFNKRLVDTVYRAYKESFSNTLPSGNKERQAYGLLAFENSRYSKDFYDKNLYTLADGATANYTAPDNTNLVINAVKRNATTSRLGDNDFFLTKPNGDIMVTRRTDTGETLTPAFIPRAEYDADKGGLKYRKMLFGSPEDIASLMGQTLLTLQAQNANASILKNKQVVTNGTSYNLGQESIKSQNYINSVNNIRKSNNIAFEPTNIKNAKGVETPINSRIKSKDLVSLKEDLPKNFKDNVYPYFHTSIANKVKDLIEENNLYVTDAFRPAGASSKMKGGAEKSLHEYAKSFDSRYDEKAQQLLSDLQNNPEKAEKLGISYAFKHVIDGVPHLHIDFH